MRIKIITLCFTFGLSVGTIYSQSIEIVDGVKIIENTGPKWGNNPEIKLEFVKKIGDLDNENENYLLFRPRDVFRDNNGNIYVLDRGNSRIQKFDNEGIFLLSIGREGQGPGEFLNPTSIEVDLTGNIYVSDFGNKRVQILSNEGKYIDSFRFFEQKYGSADGSVIKLLNQNEFIVGEAGSAFIIQGTTPGNIDELWKETFLINIIDSDGNYLKRFAKPKIETSKGIKYFSKGSFFEFDGKNHIYLTYEYENRVEKYSVDGKKIFTASRPLKFETTKLTFENNRRNLPDRVSRNIEIDNKSRIWVASQTHSDKTLYVIDIFDSEGILLGVLEYPLSDYFTRMQIFENYVYFVVNSATEMTVYEYKIIEN